MELETVTREQVGVLIDMMGMGAMLIDWHKIDYQLGRGIGIANQRFLWTTDGKRITIDGPPLIVGQTHDPDPEYADLKAQATAEPRE